MSSLPIEFLYTHTVLERIHIGKVTLGSHGTIEIGRSHDDGTTRYDGIADYIERAIPEAPPEQKVDVRAALERVLQEAVDAATTTKNQYPGSSE